jgi:hypothetical protein
MAAKGKKNKKLLLTEWLIFIHHLTIRLVTITDKQGNTMYVGLHREDLVLKVQEKVRHLLLKLQLIKQVMQLKNLE